MRIRPAAMSLAALAVVAVGVGVGVAQNRVRPNPSRSPWRSSRARGGRPIVDSVPADAGPTTPAPSSHGVTLEDGRMVVRDQTAWFQFVPEAVERAVRDGARGADGVLINVMRQTLPGHPWPPPAGSPATTQWKSMVSTVAALLNLEPEPTPQSTHRRLRVVRR